MTKPRVGLWHDSGTQGTLDELDRLCAQVAHAGLDYLVFRSHDGADERYLTDAQLASAKDACTTHGLDLVLCQRVNAATDPAAQAAAFAETLKRFEPAFAFVDLGGAAESDRAGSRYPRALREALPHQAIAAAPLGRASDHPRMDWKAWRDRGFAIAPQAMECDRAELTPDACARSFETLWPLREQWTVVGLHTGARGRLGGPHIAASLRRLPLANLSARASNEFTVPQLRGIATHPGPAHASALPAVSITTIQQQLNACGFHVPVTGTLDAATREALRFFKAGWCGQMPFRKLNDGLTVKTRTALAHAARNHGSLGRKAKNFHYQEFRLDNTGDPRVRRRVGLAAQAYRDQFGATTIVRSSSTPEHNAAVGGRPDSRHLFPKHWDAIDPSPQTHSVGDVSALGIWIGIGHHAADGTVDHLDLRDGDPHHPIVFPDH